MGDWHRNEMPYHLASVTRRQRRQRRIDLGVPLKMSAAMQTGQPHLRGKGGVG